MRVTAPVIAPSDIAGHVSARADCGLAEGTPVIAGYLDVVASALGSGVVRPGQVSIVLGTWSINQVLSSEPLVHPDMKSNRSKATTTTSSWAPAPPAACWRTA